MMYIKQLPLGYIYLGVLEQIKDDVIQKQSLSGEMLYTYRVNDYIRINHYMNNYIVVTMRFDPFKYLQINYEYGIKNNSPIIYLSNSINYTKEFLNINSWFLHECFTSIVEHYKMTF